MANENAKDAAKPNGGLRLTGEDLARIMNSLKEENEGLKQKLQEATGILMKMSVLNRVISAREGVFSEDYVKSCAEKIQVMTDEFITIQ